MTLSIVDSPKLLLLFLVVYALTIHQVASQDETDKEVSRRSRSCRAIFNKPGACVRLGSCEPYLQLLRNRPFLARRVIRRKICGISFRGILVCCPEPENDGDNSGNSNNNNNNEENNNEENNNNNEEDNNNEENNNNNEENNSENPNEEKALRPPQCGFSDKTHNRVVGGSPAELGAWPWIANIGFLTDDPDTVEIGCGGSLISSRHVLTAGHCAYKNRRYFVRLGEYDLTSDDDGANPIDISVEEVTVHPDFNPDNLENDIAILKLSKEVEFTDAIHPICLPIEDGIRNRNLVNNYPFVAGWGRTSNGGSTSDVLREVQVPVVDEEKCKNDYRDIRNVVVDDRVICAGYAEGGKDACQGDSGGPLMFPQKTSYYLIGIVSGGYQCAKPNYPGTYTRVTSFLDFILSNMK